jgi:hypothetical protein
MRFVPIYWESFISNEQKIRTIKSEKKNFDLFDNNDNERRKNEENSILDFGCSINSISSVLSF